MLFFKQILLLVITLLLAFACYSQNTGGSVAIDHEASSVNDLLKEGSNWANDTNKVNLLNRIAGKYWYKLSAYALDSCIYYANEANRLSQRLRFIPGRNQALFLLCKAYNKSNDTRSASALISQVYGEERVRLLIVNGEYYVFSTADNPKIKDKAYPFMLHAVALSDSVHSIYWRYQSYLLLGKYYFNKQDLQKGKACLLIIIDDCHKNNDVKGEAHYWSELGRYMPETDDTYKQKINCHYLAYQYYLKANDQEDAAYSLRDVVTLNFSHNLPDTALKQMLVVMAIFKSAGTKLTPNTLWLLSEVYDAKGMYKEALYFGLKAINANNAADELGNSYKYMRLAWLYTEEDLTEKALYYNMLALKTMISLDNNEKFFICYDITTEEIELRKVNEAKAFLIDFIRKNPTNDPEKQELLSAALGTLFNALKQYKLAEVNFRRMISLDNVAVNERKTIIFQGNYLQSAGAYALFGNFMVERNQYKIAKIFLEKALATQNTVGMGEVSNLEYQLFKTDSALGDPVSALKHYEKHDAIKDSLTDVSKAKQIAELRLTYEATQREQSIKLLQSDAKVQYAQLQEVSLERNLTIAGIIISLAIAALLYFFYRQKQVSNQQLKIQQNKINRQNTSLQQLVSDKNWLLKEVHHRVKNNLHIITSLLETQSSYLTNTAALEAISESQSRIKTIALIHQRLYSESNLAVIEMRSYIQELVQYLRDSFDMTGSRITFDLQIDPVNLDVQQAVPIGLILNEAITNAVKYAFNDKQFGEIAISLKTVGDAYFIFKVEDNGVGLPTDVDLQKPTSMGMGLIKGLTKQLGGNLIIESKGGTKIKVAFSKLKATDYD